MTRKLKALGLALVAVLAFGAVATSGASAATFHSEVEPTILTGDNDASNQVFTVSGITLTCTEATFKGTAALKTDGSVTVFPTYKKCKDNIGHEENTAGEPIIDTTGCAYVFSATTNAGGHIPVSVECTTNKKIIITDTSCTLSIGAQDATGGVQLTNILGPPKYVTVHATATVTVTKGPEAGCFLIGNSGTYTGTAQLKGFVDNGVSGEIDEATGHVTTYTEGPQVGIWWE